MQGKIADLADVVRREQPDLIVVAVTRSRPEVFAQLLEVADEGFSVVGLPEFYEQAFGRLPVRHLTPAWFMSVFHLYQRPYTRVVKRTSTLSSPRSGSLLRAALPADRAARPAHPGPAIYRQARLGEGGRPFTISSSARCAPTPRHGTPGRRSTTRASPARPLPAQTRLDELPQLWNVLKGDMSIVGPRPERPEFLEELEQRRPVLESRHLLKPGITGWAQVGAATPPTRKHRARSSRTTSGTCGTAACGRSAHRGKTITKLSSGSSGGR